MALQDWNHEGWDVCINTLEDMIKKAEVRERKRREEDIPQFRLALHVVMANALSALRNGETRYFHLPLGRMDYGKRCMNPQLTYDHVKSIIRTIGCNNFNIQLLEGELGYFGGFSQGLRTRLKATPWLIKLFNEYGLCEGVMKPMLSPDLNFVELKDKNKKKIYSYETTDIINSYQNNLSYINARLEEADLNLLISDNELEKVNKKISGVHDEEDDEELKEFLRSPLNFNRRYLKRVFNNNSFERGGRFYGGWWQGLPENTRKFITINKEPVVEVDFKTLVVAQLYAMKDLVYEGDDAYELDGVSRLYRKTIKRIFTRMINAKGTGSPRKADMYKYPLPEGVTIKDIEMKLMEKHQPIAEYFYKQTGLQLQFQDSQVAEYVMLTMMGDGITVLPIHDSFIVEEQYEQRLIEMMRVSYKRISGFHYAPEKDSSNKLTRDEFMILKGRIKSNSKDYKGVLGRGAIE